MRLRRLQAWIAAGYEGADEPSASLCAQVVVHPAARQQALFMAAVPKVSTAMFEGAVPERTANQCIMTWR